jgi:hypothetical protein
MTPTPLSVDALRGHTPGNWEVQDPMGDDVGLWVVQQGLEAYQWSCIAIVPRDEDRSGSHFITKREQYANARLIAAAPDLLEALVKMLDHYGPPLSSIDYHDNHPITLARAAISKATGLTP